MKVLSDYVVILEDEASAQTESGLYIPTGAVNKNPIRKGLVLGVGDQVDTLKAEERVIFNSGFATTIDHDDKQVSIIELKHVIATL